MKVFNLAIKRTHIIIPKDLVQSIDAIVGKRKRSKFITEAARKELNRLRLLRALDKAQGTWSDKDHPELTRKGGTYKWVRAIREEPIGDESKFPIPSWPFPFMWIEG